MPRVLQSDVISMSYTASHIYLVSSSSTFVRHRLRVENFGSRVFEDKKSKKSLKFMGDYERLYYE